MKVLLMVTPSMNALEIGTKDEIAQLIGLYPPLGILYVATYLKRNTSHEVFVIDAQTEQLSYNELTRRFREIRPDIVGVTAMTDTLRNVFTVLEIAKETCPGCITVLGGPHVPLYPKETIEAPNVDYAFCGDGEHSFTEFVEVMAKGLPPEEREAELRKIEGIVMRCLDGTMVQNGFARVQDLDSLPFPDRSYLKKELYFSILGRDRLMTTIMSSRGCPFGCTFCNTPDKKYRYRSPGSVVAEMEEVMKMGIEEIFFFDDLFNINEQRVLDVCDEIIRRKLKVRWAFRGRVNGITDRLVKRAREAGCDRIQYGIEKATNEGLKRVNKGITVEEIVKAVNITKKYGMMAVGNFLLFTPGEDEADAEEIIRFALGLKLDHAEFNVFTPYPGSKIYAEGLASGFFEKDHWAEYARNPTPDFQLFWEEKVPKERMFSLTMRAHKRFYLRPRIVWGELMRMRSWKELKRAVKGALVVLRLK